MLAEVFFYIYIEGRHGVALSLLWEREKLDLRLQRTFLRTVTILWLWRKRRNTRFGIENDLDVIVVRGNGARPSVLERAGLSGENTTNLLIACTNKDEVNVMACWIAKKWECSPRYLRAVGLEFTDNEHWADDLGIDMLISPERSVAKEVEEPEVGGDSRNRDMGGRADLCVPYRF